MTNHYSRRMINKDASPSFGWGNKFIQVIKQKFVFVLLCLLQARAFYWRKGWRIVMIQIKRTSKNYLKKHAKEKQRVVQKVMQDDLGTTILNLIC